jgi:hypothetical protein
MACGCKDKCALSHTQYLAGEFSLALQHAHAEDDSRPFDQLNRLQIVA